jgi:hypothetical protein
MRKNNRTMTINLLHHVVSTVELALTTWSMTAVTVVAAIAKHALLQSIMRDAKFSNAASNRKVMKHVVSATNFLVHY